MRALCKIHSDLFSVCCIVPCQFSLFVSGMGKHCPADGIPDCPDVFYIRLEVVVNLDEIGCVGLDPRMFRSQQVGVGGSACGNDHRLCYNLFFPAGIGIPYHHGMPLDTLSHGDRLGTQVQLDASSQCLL